MGRSSLTPSRMNTVVECSCCTGFVGRHSNIKKWRSVSEKQDKFYWYHYVQISLTKKLLHCCMMWRWKQNSVQILQKWHFQLTEVLQIPEQLYCYNRLKVCGTEVFCMFLRRFSYPCHFTDTIPRFAQPVPQIYMITNMVISHISGISYI